MKIELTNDFHNTKTFVLTDEDGYITAGQVKRAWRNLCGIRECTCGNILGARGKNNPIVDYMRDGCLLYRVE